MFITLCITSVARRRPSALGIEMRSVISTYSYNGKETKNHGNETLRVIIVITYLLIKK